MVKQFAVESCRLAVEDKWGIVETISEKENAFGYRFYPDKVKGEGFFVAAFKKKQAETGSVIDSGKQKPKNKTEKLPARDIEILEPYLLNTSDYFFIKQNEEVIAIPIYLEDELARIQSCLYIKKAGVKLGTIIRNELIPAHDLAISCILNTTLPKFEVDKETALQYLRKQEIKMETGIKGWVLLTHEQLPVGWIKIIANRINNYYPKHWRILNK